MTILSFFFLTTQIFEFTLTMNKKICVVKKKKERIVIIRSNLNAILYNDHVLIRK